MSDNASDFGAAIDPVPVELIDDNDHVSHDALVAHSNSMVAARSVLGNDPARFTVFGALDHGTVGSFITASSRLIWGEQNCSPLEASAAELTNAVDFPAGLFTETPIVLTEIFLDGHAGPGQRYMSAPQQVTTDGFIIALGWEEGSSPPAGLIPVMWFAIQPPFPMVNARVGFPKS